VAESLSRLAAQCVANGIRFRCQRVSGSMTKPKAVSLELTHRCVARCIMCNIWRIPPDKPSLSGPAWISLLTRELFSDLVELDITGGEPFLRADLADLLSEVCRLKAGHLASLKSIAITTNGFLTRRVLARTRQILSEAKRHGVTLVMVCAMDAIGKAHDGVRRYPGGWQRVDQTIQGLSRLRKGFPNLIIGLKTTILPATVGHLDAIARYAARHNLFTIISPCIITKGRYLNQNLGQDLAFKPEQIEQMVRFFQKNRSRWSFHDEHLVRYFQTGRMKKPCSCGFNYFFIRSQGDLHLCPMVGASPGNVTQTPIDTLLSSQAAARIRRRIGRFPECRHCTEPGLERYSLPYEGWSYLAMLPKMGRRRFRQMHRDMGLDKYFAEPAANAVA
jgi:MoaA/NifB/PqqE/SkfB family radical SAM enzyme